MSPPQLRAPTVGRNFQSSGSGVKVDRLRALQLVPVIAQSRCGFGRADIVLAVAERSVVVERARG